MGGRRFACGVGLSLSAGFVALAFLIAFSLRADDDHLIGRGGSGGAPTQRLTAVPCVNGTANVFPCANVDLMAFLPLSDLGGAASGNDVWGWTDPQTNREYALMGLSTGTAFVDVTDPQNPIHLGNLSAHSTNSLWRDIKVYADHAYIVSEAAGHGLQVFDLTQLRNVAAPPVTFVETAHYTGFSNAHNLAINADTGFAYVVGSNTCAGGLHFVDIRAPAAPVAAGCFSADGYTHDTQCVIYNGPDSAHGGREICFNSNEDTLTIVDVTNKLAPVPLSRTGYFGHGYTHQGWLTEDHRYFLLDDELDEANLGVNTRTHIWDVSDLDAPVRAGIYEAAVGAIDHNQYVVGNFTYQANYRSGLRILDLSSVAFAQLREVAYFDVYPTDDNIGFDGSWSVYPFFSSGNVLISGIGEGLFVVRPFLAGSPMGLPNFTWSSSPASATVTRGQSATFTMTATPQNGFSSSITLACGTLPPGVNCSFSPPTLTPASGPASASVTVSTSASSAPPPVQAAGALPSVFLVFGVVSIAALIASQRIRPILALSVLCVLILLTPACGGGTATPPAPPPPPPPAPPAGTPPGSYVVTVQATSGSIIRSADITLIVR